MDIYDKATELEELDRSNAIRNALRPANSAIAKKRKIVAEAREAAGQHALGSDDLISLGVTCENCEDVLTLKSEDIFCCKDCADDWSRRDRAQRRAGR